MGHRSFRRPRVMLVADERTRDALLPALAEQIGHDVVVSCDSLRAVLGNDLAQFDVLLCSGTVPDATGPRLARTVLALREAIAVVGILDSPDLQLAAEFFEAGAVECIVHTTELTAYIGVIVEKSRARLRVQLEERRLLRELQSAMGQMKRKNDELREAVAHLETMVWTDALTGLANRRQLDERLPQLFAEAVRYSTDLTCLMIDLDGFKQINDTLGHARGDELLVLTGEIIHDEIRASDLAARYGGDEFVILMPRSGWKTGSIVGRRLCQAFVHHAATAANGGIRCGMSIGVSSLQMSSPMNGHELITHADNALYAAKQAGKNLVMICGPDGVNAENSAA